MDTMEREMLSQVMAMEVMDLPPSVVPSLITDMEDTEDMVTMAREMLRLSQDMVLLPATLTDLHRVSLLDMVVMGMEDMVVMVTARDLLSQVMVMLLLLTTHMEDPALSTEAPKV